MASRYQDDAEDAARAAAAEEDPGERLRFERRAAFYKQQAKQWSAKVPTYEALQRKLDEADRRRRRKSRSRPGSR